MLLSGRKKKKNKKDFEAEHGIRIFAMSLRLLFISIAICACCINNCTSWEDKVAEEGFENVEISSMCTAGCWQLQPKDESGLQCVVPGDVIEDKAKSQTLEEIQETEDDPVSEPLGIVMGGS